MDKLWSLKLCKTSRFRTRSSDQHAHAPVDNLPVATRFTGQSPGCLQNFPDPAPLAWSSLPDRMVLWPPRPLPGYPEPLDRATESIRPRAGSDESLRTAAPLVSCAISIPGQIKFRHINTQNLVHPVLRVCSEAQPIARASIASPPRPTTTSGNIDHHLLAQSRHGQTNCYIAGAI